MKLHFYRVEIESGYIYRLLNHSGNINLRNIRIQEETTNFIVDYREFEDLKNILNKFNIPVLRLEEKGLYATLVNFPVLKIIIGTVMVFILLIGVNSLFIWKISVDGNYSYSENQIVSFIKEQDICEGIIKTKIDCNGLEKEIRKNFNDISWVCAEIKGTNLIIHVKENYITEISVQEDEPYDIVANRDGKIMSILVRKGKAMVKAGDRVKKGDVLISGVVDVFDESEQKLFTKFCNSDGDIVGKTVYDYKDSLKIDYTQKIIRKKRTVYLPSAFEYKWMNLAQNNNKDIIYSENKLKIYGNFYLPFSIQKYVIVHYKNNSAAYTKEQAEQILNNRLSYKLAIMEQKGYKILKKDVKINKEKDSYILAGKITCQEPMGMVSYIDVNQYSNQSEEGTTEFNERN